MKIVDKRLIETSELINKHLDKIKADNRAEESTEILSNVRNYCELVLYKIYDEEKNEDLYQTQDNLKKVRKFMQSFNPKFDRIHQLLDPSGHITFGKEQSEALMIKYIPMLISLKLFLLQHYSFDTLESIDKYPLKLDDSLVKFYKKILYAIDTSNVNSSIVCKDLFHISKKTMKYIDNHIFYEYVLDVSDDRPNKFNTVVAYSKLNIDLSYDMSFLMTTKLVNFLDTQITINIITDYEVFIRPCSFKKLAYMINVDLDIKSRSLVYKDLMKIIKEKNYTLLDIIENNVVFSTKKDVYSTFIDKIKSFISKDQLGVKIVKYLLLNMRYNVVKGQVNSHLFKGHSTLKNPFYNDLIIGSGSLGFEYNPVALSPQIERPSIEDLSRIINLNDYEHEFLYRRMENYINQNNSLFVDCGSLGYSKDRLEELIDLYNQKLYYYYDDYQIIKVYDKYTIKFYYEATINVIEAISRLNKKQNVVLNYPIVDNPDLSKDKNDIINKAFKNSSICIVTGAAGTGKTRLIHEYITLNPDDRILCLTTTNTAKNNLKKNYSNVTYKNTSEKWKSIISYDLIIIDEAGFVCTEVMNGILQEYPDANYLIVGDPYQIESIEFGNWFKLTLSLFKNDGFIFDLAENHRTKVDELQKVWNAVRFLDGTDENKILELMSAFHFAKILSKDAFTIENGQVVLCLNYDGLYGINNLNRYLQSTNKNIGYTYQQNIYKVGDPVVFIINDFEIFGLYNNIKGEIVEIENNGNEFIFKIKLDKNLNNNFVINEEISIDSTGTNSIVTVRKIVPSYESFENELNQRLKLPFQLAYSMSIHKAQGLEFDKVKIIITSDTEEYISKNIFYTAITRAKKYLEIYWDPEVPNKLFNNMIEESKSSICDIGLFKRLIGEKKIDL